MPRLRRLLALGCVVLVPLLGGCSHDPRDPRTQGQRGKVCGIFDRDRIVALGLTRDDIRATGQVQEKSERETTPLVCQVRDAASGNTVLRVVVRELTGEAEEISTTSRIESEYDAKLAHPAPGEACSQPDPLTSIGTGYACRRDGVIRVTAVAPGRLVRLAYRPVLVEPHAAEYARAIGLIGNLQENVVAFDQRHPTATPTASPSSPST